MDSSKTGKDEEEMIERLLRVEQTGPTRDRHPRQHAQKRLGCDQPLPLSPLPAANARILIEQSIGRGCGALR